MTEISEQFEDSLNKLKSIYRLRLKEEIPYFAEKYILNRNIESFV